jgi:hypothetical protein
MLGHYARRRCVSLAASLIDRWLQYREENRNTETMGRLVTQRFRPTRPPGRSGPLDRTAGGIGGAAPASLDLYGQSRTIVVCNSWVGKISLPP